MKPGYQTEGKRAVDLLEEAILLLRKLPFLSWAALYFGALPYVLVFLLYLMNLAHNPAVSEQLVGYSALLAVLYVWMRVWQTAFAAQVWRERAGTSIVGWTFHSILRVACDHLRYSVVSLVGLAASTLLVFPLAWHYALHQSLVLLVIPGFDTHRPGAGPVKRSWEQARLWSGQNHLIMLLLGLISVIIFLNVAACLVVFPYLLKLLTGWESAFTRLGVRLFDFKMLFAAIVLTYLAVLPLARVVYVLRCFYGSSLKTGADLLSELRSTKVAALILACLFLTGGSQVLASQPAEHEAGVSVTSAHPSIPAARLDASISTVLQSRKHLWQAPAGARRNQDPSIWRDLGRAVRRWLETTADWLVRVLRWLRPADSPSRPRHGRSVDIRDVAKVLLVVCAVGLAFLITRTLLERRSRSGRPVAISARQPVDLRSAEVSPEELPEERWLELARDMMENGQARLAMRAVYLAAIVILGKRELVTPTRFKSNRDYLLELRRRHRGSEMPVTSFQSMIGLFEKVWYGRHEPGRTDFEEMHRLLAALRA
jgi:hypothetical protein